jgi:hypothetical protein
MASHERQAQSRLQGCDRSGSDVPQQHRSDAPSTKFHLNSAVVPLPDAGRRADDPAIDALANFSPCTEKLPSAAQDQRIYSLALGRLPRPVI